MLKHLNIRLLQTCGRYAVGFNQKRELIYSNKKDVSRDFLAFIQQDIDFRPKPFKRWKKRKEMEVLIKLHTYNPERIQVLGPDLATAHFIIANGGAIRFVGMDQWYEKDEEGKVPKTVPNLYHPEYRVEAVDASHTKVLHCSFDNFGPLQHMRYLNLSHCENIDDWCLDRLVDFRHILQYLDLRGCPRVTERGLATLHKLKKLKRLCIHDMPNVRYKTLTALMLEENLPDCAIEGVNFNMSPDQFLQEEAEMERDLFEKYEVRLNAALTEDLKKGYSPNANMKL